MQKYNSKRETVTPEDRRVVFIAARARTRQAIMGTPNEVFIRNMLKDRMGWSRKEPSPNSIKAATREISTALK